MHAPLAMTYRTEWNSLAALEEIAPEWKDLAARAIEPNVFYEPAFALPAAGIFGHDAGAVLVRASSGRLAGFFPMRAKRFGVAKGYVHPYAPLGLPLVERNDPDGVVDAWLTHLAKENRAVLLPMLPAGPFADALARVCAGRTLRVAQFGAHDRTLLAPGSGRSSYLDRSLGSKGGKGLLRRRKRLAEQGELVHRAMRGAEVKELIDAFLALEARGWKGRAGTAAGGDAALADFMKKAVTALAAEGKAQGDMLALNGAPIAAIIVLRSGATAWTWKIAYDERYAQYSPGVQAALDATRRLIEDATIERADSCTAPGTNMIDRLWHERLAMSDWLISLRPGPSVHFSALRAAEALRRTAIAAAKSLLRR
jgi:CelD/BcsL family acetyltransferase involved in cellulose biosynthesis